MAPLVRASHKYLATLDDSQATGVPSSPGASTSAAAIPAAPSASAAPSTPVASSSRRPTPVASTSRRPTPVPSTSRPSRVASGSHAGPVRSSSRAARVASTSRAAPYPGSPRPRRARSSAEVPVQYVGRPSLSAGTLSSIEGSSSRARRVDLQRLDRASLEHYAKLYKVDPYGKTNAEIIDAVFHDEREVVPAFLQRERSLRVAAAEHPIVERLGIDGGRARSNKKAIRGNNPHKAAITRRARETEYPPPSPAATQVGSPADTLPPSPFRNFNEHEDMLEQADSSDAGPSRRDKGKGVDRGPPSPTAPSPFTRLSRVPLGQIGPDVFSSSLPAFQEEVDDNPAYAVPDATTLHEMADGLQGDSAEVQAEIDRIRLIVNELVVQANLAEYEAEEALEAYRALLSHVDELAGPEFAVFVRNEAAAVVVPDLEEWNYDDESQGTVGDEREEAPYQEEPAQDGQRPSDTLSYLGPSSPVPPTSPLARVHGKRRHDDEEGPGADDDAPASPKRPRVEDDDSAPAPAAISRNPSPATHSRSPSPASSEESLHRERTPSRSGSEDRSGSGSESGSERHHVLWDSPSSGSGKTCSVCGGKPVGSFCWTDLVSPDGWEPRALPARSSHQCRPARDISSWQSSVQEAQAGPSGAHDGSGAEEEEREDADDEAGAAREEHEISVEEERDEEYQTLAQLTDEQLAADLATEEDNFPDPEELADLAEMRQEEEDQRAEDLEKEAALAEEGLEQDELEEEDELAGDVSEEEDELAGDVSEEEDQLADDSDAVEVPDKVAEETDSGIDVSDVLGEETDDAMDDGQQEVQAPVAAPTPPAALAPSTPPAAPALVPGFQFPETANYRSPGIVPPLVESSPPLPRRPYGDEGHYFRYQRPPVWVPPRSPPIS
ncbi:hypothetical protein BD413DRAFT_669056 [Trametes elegans]|nr:hypothetical protein BD413DRAFT_669056 [Trametes elegans]